MVDGESKATLRSAVADAVLEYRRTSRAAGAEQAQQADDGVVDAEFEEVKEDK